MPLAVNRSTGKKGALLADAFRTQFGSRGTQGHHLSVFLARHPELRSLFKYGVQDRNECSNIVFCLQTTRPSL